MEEEKDKTVSEPEPETPEQTPDEGALEGSAKSAVDAVDEQKPAEDKTATETEENSASEEPVDPEKTIEEAITESESKNEEKSDEEIDAAVDDIVKTESDTALAEADAKLEAATTPKKKDWKQKVCSVIATWWRTPMYRNTTFAVLGILIVLCIFIPTTRYATLNLFGVRVTSSMRVVDSQTQLPLKNISVQIQDQEALTDDDGNVDFSGLKLGSTELSITKRGYAENIQNIILGWGSNPIGNQPLVATGEQFRFVLSDWQSNEPVLNGEATSGENSAIADDQGLIILTVGEEDIAEVEVTINAEGYREETITDEQLEQEEILLAMVPSKKHAFVSNRSGQYDLYSIDVDGKNEAVVLGATGEEREVPQVIVHPTRDIIAFVSSRDGERNSDGFALDGLYIVDLNSSETKRVTRSEQMQVIGWSGDDLVFWQVVEGTSAGNPQRSKLISYNERTTERTEIAAGNYFNDVELVGNKLYYAISSFAVPQSFAKLYAAEIGATDNEKILDSQVWNIFRTGYDTLLFSAENQKWYEQSGDGQPEEVPQQSSPTVRRFVDSPNGEKTAWVEIRDGKGVLLSSNTDKINEDQILALPGVDQVLQWVSDDTLIFRVITNSETADYVVSLAGGGVPIKLTDVTATRNPYF